ncbi:MAG TPA: hypothetical protein PK691_07830, partial [Thermomicrobiales bacterium]|nr:hypothetical protein [Thermomicrobiales bacterium]
PGPIHRFVPPLGSGIRVDTAVTSGSVISDRYDSMIAKLVVTGRNRDEAIARGQRALAEMQIEGVPTTQSLHQNILASDRFRSANLSVGFLADEPEVVPAPALQSALEPDAPSPWSEQVVEVNGKRFTVRRPASHAQPASTSSSPRPKRNRSRHSNTLSNTSGPLLASPYQGSVLRVVRQPGDTVTVGQTVLVIEAMKMENEIAAHCDGTLVSVLPQPGTSVRIGDPLFVIE